MLPGSAENTESGDHIDGLARSSSRIIVIRELLISCNTVDGATGRLLPAAILDRLASYDTRQRPLTEVCYRCHQV